MVIRRILAAVGISIVLLMTLAPPASAHDTEINFREDRAWVREGHTRIRIIDGVCRNSTWVHYEVQTIGGIAAFNLYAPCGGIATSSTYPNSIMRYQICEANYGCSPYRPA